MDYVLLAKLVHGIEHMYRYLGCSLFFSDKSVEEKMGFGVNFKSDISPCRLGG